MRQPRTSEWTMQSLAPIAFVAGVLLTGLGLLALTVTATAPGFGPVEQSELTVVDDTAVLAYPVPLSPHVATTIDVTFAYPRGAGSAMLVGCGEYSAIRQGQEPEAARSSTAGTSGRLSSTVAPDATAEEATPSVSCPFMYAVFQWPLQGGDPAANRPDASVVTSPVVLPAVATAVSAVLGLGGLALALVGGTAWSRDLRARRLAAAGEDESTTETLLLLVDKMGTWLTRTRRYLLAAGILGVFLWYPVVLTWTWGKVMGGSTHAWALTGAALAVLLAITFVWAREYLRLDRELLAWRRRIDRLHERERAMLDDLERAG